MTGMMTTRLTEHPEPCLLPIKNYEETIMKCNVGGIDRNSRIVVGIVLLVVGIAAPIEMTWRIVALVIAAIALLTAIVRFCPANALLGCNTCKEEKKQ
jgi:hypothetical protein